MLLFIIGFISSILFILLIYILIKKDIFFNMYLFYIPIHIKIFHKNIKLENGRYKFISYKNKLLNKIDFIHYYDKYGQFHRQEGPAIIHYKNNKIISKLYFINGQRLKEEKEI